MNNELMMTIIDTGEHLRGNRRNLGFCHVAIVVEVGMETLCIGIVEFCDGVVISGILQ